MRQDWRTIKLFDDQGSVIGWLDMPMSARIADIDTHLSALGAARLELVADRRSSERRPAGAAKRPPPGAPERAQDRGSPAPASRMPQRIGAGRRSQARACLACQPALPRSLGFPASP